MGKLRIYYIKHNDLLVGDILKLKIDENIKTEIKKDEFKEFDIEDGSHNIKMYFEGFSADEMHGYIDQNIEIQGDNNYYIYQAPKVLNGKAKFEKKDFNNDKDFSEFVQKSNKKYKTIGIILLILLVLAMLFFA